MQFVGAFLETTMQILWVVLKLTLAIQPLFMLNWWQLCWLITMVGSLFGWNLTQIWLIYRG